MKKPTPKPTPKPIRERAWVKLGPSAGLYHRDSVDFALLLWGAEQIEGREHQFVEVEIRSVPRKRARRKA